MGALKNQLIAEADQASVGNAEELRYLRAEEIGLATFMERERKQANDETLASIFALLTRTYTDEDAAWWARQNAEAEATDQKEAI